MKKQYLLFLALAISFVAFGIINPVDVKLLNNRSYDFISATNDAVDCDVANQCTYTFEMTDQFGDGWNGGTMTVFQNGEEVETFGLTGGATGSIEIALCDGEPFSLYWNAGGSFSYEVGITILDAFGEEVYTKPPNTGSPDSELYDGVVDCTVPSCPKPINAEVEVTESTATVSWTEQGDATEWEVIILPQGSGEPDGAEDGLILTTENPYTFEDLVSATNYVIYVRSVCEEEDVSGWRGPIAFTTSIDNDECDEATVVPVNIDATCTLTVDGTFTGATLSENMPGGCNEWAVVYKDVWFEFVATESAHAVSVQNAFNPWDTNFQVFHEDICDDETLEYMGCANDFMILSNLIVGETYKIRVFATWDITSSFEVCVRTLQSPDNDDCDDAINVPVNTDATCTLTTPGTFQDASLSSIGSEIDCYDWDPAAKDVWFEFVATEAIHKVTILNNAETWSTYVEVFDEADCNTEGATPLACGQGTVLIGGLTVGDTYKIRVSTYSATNNATFDVCVRTLQAPDNDDCDGAIELPVSETMECEETVTGTFSDASLSEGVSNGCNDWGEVPAMDVWYEFEAITTTHGVILTSDGGTWNVYIEIYEEDICTGYLDPIECAQTTELVVNDLTPGNTYKVRIFSTSITDEFDFEVCVISLFPPIRVADDEHTVEELVENILIGDSGDCTGIANINSITGIDFTDPWSGQPGPNGIAYFEKNGSEFPFENGIVLSTCRALDAEGPAGTPIDFENGGDASWLDDNQLTEYMNNVLGNNDNYHNATVLEFDFTPASDSLKFNFIFASNEYGTYQCDFSDAFAFFLTDLETGVVENLAIVPGTTDPISVTTIRDCQYYNGNDCSFGDGMPCSRNEEYFDSFYGNPNGLPLITSPINFYGRTVPMTAKGPVVPGKTYRIKMVIQDRGDSGVDSAVFLEGGSFDIGSVDLGGDMLIEDLNAVCEDDQVLLDTQLDPEKYTFEWYKDDVLIEGETGPTLIVTETGVYRIEAYYEGNTTCGISDSVLIEIYPIIVLDEDLDDIDVCVIPDRMPEVDITIHEPVFDPFKLAGADFEYSYHLSENEALDDLNAIENPEAYVPTQIPVTIYIRIYNTLTECVQVFDFDIIRRPIINFTPHNDIPICVYPDYFTTTNLTQVEPFFTDQTLTSLVFSGYYLDQTDAYSLTNAITNTTDFLVEELPTTIYMAILNEETGCYSFTSFNIVATETLDPMTIEDIVICDGYLVPELPAGQYYSTQEFGQGDIIQPGRVLGMGNHVMYINVENEIGCVFSHRYEIHVTECTPPRGISPNGDGLNDNFDLTDYHLLELKIFNRHGIEVYAHGLGYTNQWEGQSSNGDLLPDGTYYYHFITPTGLKTGYVQLVREVR